MQIRVRRIKHNEIMQRRRYIYIAMKNKQCSEETNTLLATKKKRCSAVLLSRQTDPLND